MDLEMRYFEYFVAVWRRKSSARVLQSFLQVVLEYEGTTTNR